MQKKCNSFSCYSLFLILLLSTFGCCLYSILIFFLLICFRPPVWYLSRIWTDALYAVPNHFTPDKRFTSEMHRESRARPNVCSLPLALYITTLTSHIHAKRVYTLPSKSTWSANYVLLSNKCCASAVPLFGSAFHWERCVKWITVAEMHAEFIYKTAWASRNKISSTQASADAGLLLRELGAADTLIQSGIRKISSFPLHYYFHSLAQTRSEFDLWGIILPWWSTRRNRIRTPFCIWRLILRFSFSFFNFRERSFYNLFQTFIET